MKNNKVLDNVDISKIVMSSLSPNKLISNNNHNIEKKNLIKENQIKYSSGVSNISDNKIGMSIFSNLRNLRKSIENIPQEVTSKNKSFFNFKKNSLFDKDFNDSNNEISENNKSNRLFRDIKEVTKTNKLFKDLNEMQISNTNSNKMDFDNKDYNKEETSFYNKNYTTTNIKDNIKNDFEISNVSKSSFSEFNKISNNQTHNLQSNSNKNQNKSNLVKYTKRSSLSNIDNLIKSINENHEKRSTFCVGGYFVDLKNKKIINNPENDINNFSPIPYNIIPNHYLNNNPSFFRNSSFKSNDIENKEEILNKDKKRNNKNHSFNNYENEKTINIKIIQEKNITNENKHLNKSCMNFANNDRRSESITDKNLFSNYLDKDNREVLKDPKTIRYHYLSLKQNKNEDLSLKEDYLKLLNETNLNKVDKENLVSISNDELKTNKKAANNSDNLCNLYKYKRKSTTDSIKQNKLLKLNSLDNFYNRDIYKDKAEQKKYKSFYRSMTNFSNNKEINQNELIKIIRIKKINSFDLCENNKDSVIKNKITKELMDNHIDKTINYTKNENNLKNNFEEKFGPDKNDYKKIKIKSRLTVVDLNGLHNEDDLKKRIIEYNKNKETNKNLICSNKNKDQIEYIQSSSFTTYTNSEFSNIPMKKVIS